jgi:hypothetical protein
VLRNLKKAKSAVLTVGEGRGFVIKTRGEPVVVTGAHCLPKFPPCHGMSYTHDRTYPDLLGPLGKAPTVWAECFFVDPIADIAVLGTPDNQDLFKQAQAYETLVASLAPLRIADAPENGLAWLLSLVGEWFECTVEVLNDSSLWISKPAQPILGGMSGSPIVADDGKAIGVICCAGPEADMTDSLNPRLVRDLPVRFLRTRPTKPKGVRPSAGRTTAASDL